MNPKPNPEDIGDCLIFPKENTQTYYGLLLWQIIETVEYTHYSFLIAGHFFNRIPNLDMFLNAGLLGKKIPSRANSKEIQDGSYRWINKYSIGFDTIQISIEDYFTILKQAVIVGNIDFAFDSFTSAGSTRLLREYRELIPVIEELLERVGAKAAWSPDEQEILSVELIQGIGENKAQKKITQQWVLSKKNAQKIALELLPDDFYWTETDPAGPFGNDSGQDALYSYQLWLQQYPQAQATDFIKALEKQWNFNFQEYTLLQQPSRSLHGNNSLLSSLDKIMVGLCFAQILLEGKIHPQFKNTGIIALERQIANLPASNNPASKPNRDKMLKQLALLKKLL